MAHLAAYLAGALLLVVCGYAVREVRRGALDALMQAGLASNLFGIAVLWLRADKPVEGPVLLAMAHSHGVTVADLLTVLPVAVIGWLLRQSARVSARENRR